MQTNLTQKLSEDEIPLFPLHVVLFPGSILPLHIFEKRYRLMTQFCLDNDLPFGVVLIKKGREVGEHADPHLVGTAVKIIESERLEDGRMNLITLGQYRFEIIKIRRNLPYLVGQVRKLGTADPGTYQNLEMLSARAGQLYRSYESLLAQLFAEWEAAEDIPTTPHHLSYQIGTRLQIPLTDKQRLLETSPIDQLLSREIELLEQENQKLRASQIARSALEKRDSPGVPSRKRASLN